MVRRRTERDDRDAIEARLAEEEEQIAASMLPRRRYDAVAECPATLLHKLVEMAPAERRDALIEEMVTRRPEVFERQ
jgi:hypothetical protein